MAKNKHNYTPTSTIKQGLVALWYSTIKETWTIIATTFEYGTYPFWMLVCVTTGLFMLVTLLYMEILLSFAIRLDPNER